ncbi:MAG: hypothetical protein J5630_07160 [Bacteroidaceae bacterium]|nr:hypothetical protein [Bacteroidaceae bacterium]
MLKILGYLLLIGIAILVLKFAFSFIMRCCILGIIAFLCVGAITGALSILGLMEYETAWTISKWAFYIGTTINILEVIFHPFRAISDAWEVAIDDSDSNSSSNSSNNTLEDEFAGMHCCGNCRWSVNAYRGSRVMCNQNHASDYKSVTDWCSDYCHF